MPFGGEPSADKRLLNACGLGSNVANAFRRGALGGQVIMITKNDIVYIVANAFRRGALGGLRGI